MNATEVHIIEFTSSRTLFSYKYKKPVRLIDILQAVKDNENILVRTKQGKDITAYTLSRAFLKHVILPEEVYRSLIEEFYEAS